MGKGGSGKSLVAGTLARLLARAGHKVIALDSDPMPGLAVSLGLGPLDTPMLTDAVAQNDKGRWRLKKGIGPATAVRDFAIEGPDGVRLLQFGKAASEGLKPIMGSLNGFYQVVHRLARDDVLKDWSVVGDLPAGPRQAAYNWAPYARTILLVVEPTWQSALTARRITRIVRTKGAAEILLIANKTTQAGGEDLVAERLGHRPFGSIPADGEAAQAEREGKAPLDAAPDGPAVRAIEEICSRLIRRNVQRVRAG